MRNIFSYILKRIEKEDSIVIFNHANCDGDCYGSQIGLKEIILSTYPDKKVFVVGSGFLVFLTYLVNQILLVMR